MADERISTILAVELDAAKVAQDLEELSRQIANVKNEQKQLDAEFKAGNISASDYAKSTAAMKDELTWLQKQQKGAVATTKLLTAQTDTYSDSLNGQRQKLADMQKTYDQLTQAQRESAGGREFLKALQEQTAVVSELEAATGRHQRNVGNYPRVVQAIIPGFDKLTKTLRTIGVSFDDFAAQGTKAFAYVGTSLKNFGKALLTPPIALVTVVLSAIMAIVQGITNAFKKNDDAMTALTKAFAVFQPIGDGVKKIFNLLAEVLAKVATGIAKVVSWVAEKLSPGFAEAAEKAQELVKAQDDLQEAERRYTENSAKRSAQVAELRAKAAQSEKYTSEQRKRFLEEAIALERQNLEEAKTNAAERVRILEETAKKESDTSDETKDKIAQARAAMYQAEEQYYSGVRRLETQLQAFIKEERQKAVDTWYKDWNDRRLLIEAEQATMEARTRELQAQAQAMLAELDESEDEEEIPTPEEQARRLFGLDEQGVQYFLQLLDEGASFGEAKMAALADQWSRNAKGILQIGKNIGAGFTALGDMVGAFADESEDAAKAQKAFAFIGILTNQAMSISEGALALAKGIESAAGVPFPANIPAIVSITAAISSMLAGIASTIVQSKQIFAQTDAGNFATGGVVGGTSYTGDKLIAHVNSGEGIYTGKQANTLLQQIANNPLAGNGENLAQAFAQAVASLPAPKMVYEEFETFKGNVATYDEYAKI